MSMLKMVVRSASAGLVALTLGACAQAGTLGDVLGGVLNSPTNQSQMSGTIQGVDTRNQTLVIRQSDGTSIGVQYDNRTQVVYQNQTYSVGSLENGDQVTARITPNGNSYYTDYVQVTASASNTTTSGSNALYNLSGNVRQVDTVNGWFTVDTQNYGTVTISMPYNPRTTDLNRFRNLRSGDYVSLQGVQLNQYRFELRQFYQ